MGFRAKSDTLLGEWRIDAAPTGGPPWPGQGVVSIVTEATVEAFKLISDEYHADSESMRRDGTQSGVV